MILVQNQKLLIIEELLLYSPSKTSSKLATAQGTSLTKYRKIQLFLSYFESWIEIEFPCITKYVPIINILNCKLHIKDKYTKLDSTSPTFFQRLNK